MNIGFVINNLANSELSHGLLDALYKFTENDNNNSYCIFFQNLAPEVMTPPCMTINISGLSGFKGKAVALDLDSAEVLNTNYSITDNYLYLWDIAWLYAVVNYTACVDLLSNFKIITRSESHRDIVSNYTGREDIEIAETPEEMIKWIISKN